MRPLVACPGCSTHVGAGEGLCPFCGRTLRAPDGSIAQTTAAVMLGLSVGGIACTSTPVYGVAEDVSVTTSGVSPTGGPPCTDPSPIPPGGPFPSLADAPAACARAVEPVSDLDMPGIRTWLPRRWFLCIGEPLFGRQHIGLEFVSDNTWFFLDQVGDELVRSADGGNWFAEGPACTLGDVELIRLETHVTTPVKFYDDPLTLGLFVTGHAAEYVAIGDGAGGAGGAGGSGGGR